MPTRLRGLLVSVCLTALVAAIPRNVHAQLPKDEWPVLFVHGFCSDSATWKTMLHAIEPDPRYGSNSGQTRLYYDGVSVRKFDDLEHPLASDAFESSTSKKLFTIDFYNPIAGTFDAGEVAQMGVAYKAYEIRQVLEEVKRISGSGNVIVVTHSLGGLAARAYVQGFASNTNGTFGSDTVSYQNDTPLIVTIDTPHEGAYLAAVQEFIGAFPKCAASTSRNQSELLPFGRIFDLMNLTKNAGTLPSAWSGVDHSIPANVNIASIASYDPIVISTLLTLSGGDGVVTYVSQNLARVRGEIFRGHDNILGVENRIGFGTGYIGEFHTRVHSLPQTIALVRQFTDDPPIVFTPQLRVGLETLWTTVDRPRTMTGWAFTCGGTVTGYEVWVDGTARPIPVTAAVSRPTVAARYRPECPGLPDTIGLSFTLDPAALELAVGVHTVKVYAHDSFGQTRITDEIAVTVTKPLYSPAVLAISPSAVDEATSEMTFTLSGLGLGQISSILLVDPLGLPFTAAALAPSSTRVSFKFAPDYPGTWRVRARLANGVSSSPIALLVRAAVPTLSRLTTDPFAPVAGQPFTFALDGTNLNTATAEVLFSGPGCTPCIIQTNALAKTPTRITGSTQLEAAGEYTVAVRNRPSAAPSGTITMHVLPGGPPLPGLLQLPNTGTAGIGQPDPYYTVVAAPTCHDTACDAITSGGDGVSAFIRPTSEDTHPGGRYVYRLTFTVLSADAPFARISGRWAADDAGADILINGASTGMHTSQVGVFSLFSVTSGFKPGVNTLDFVTDNQDCGACVGNPTALRVELRGTLRGTAETPTLFYDRGETFTSFGTPVIDSQGRVLAVRSLFGTGCGFGFCEMRLAAIGADGQPAWETPALPGGDTIAAKALFLGENDRAHILGRTTISAIGRDGHSVAGWPVQLAPVFNWTFTGIALDAARRTVFASLGVFGSCFNSCDKIITATNADGSLRWQNYYPQDGTAHGVVPGPGGQVFTIATTGRPARTLIGLDPTTGAETCSSAGVNYLVGGPLAVFSSTENRVIAFDAQCQGLSLYLSPFANAQIHAYVDGRGIGIESSSLPGSVSPRLFGVSTSGTTWHNADIVVSPGLNPVRAASGSSLYVVGGDPLDFGVQKVFELDAGTGQIRRRIATEGVCNQCGVAVAPDGTLYINDLDSTRIYRVPR
jgi:pimeloyl-ACP methyl ester carboxylesterase